ncbi:Sir2 silent information regulator family NAD-dependent deacetylase [Clostridiaceae bacterium]|nr:Sir2 silent information regulator family NAD-dependent deacetylase [Lachnospiraceae bacterium]NBH17310.1 Sir2 silent information regulator family NAD-dependent deacetylase [Clostridiaceae bacterium]
MKINPLVEKVHKNIEDADAVVIGAGAGLSASAGFTYSGKRFEDHFPDFIERYGFTDMYSAGFYPYKTFEEHWAFWSRYIFINRYQNAPKSVYNDLYNLIKNKDYFVLTTNVDHCFQKAGFDKHRLFYTQGDYGLWQCSKPCHHKTYDNEAVIKKMVAKQKNMRIPSSLIPYCPLCGLPMSMNLRADNTFVEDNGWHTAAKRYQDFLHCHKRLKILYLELGVGSNTPGIIKYPFWQMTYNNPNASYVSINLSNASIPEEISRQSVCIDHDIGDILKQLTKNT